MSATCIVNQGEIRTKCLFSYTLVIDAIKNVGQDATIYDRELKMHFEDRSARATVYEIEIDNVHLNLHQSLAKATDFIRRTFYRYNWIQLRVNRQGKVLAIDNSKEIIKQWNEIRTSLLYDYKGKQTENYVEKIDAKMAETDFSFKSLSQYFYMGLLFPAIPTEHNSQWQRNRTVELSDFEDIQLDEHITYVRTTDSKLREYNINGELPEGENCKLEKFSGNVIVPCDEVHPVKAQVDVVYNNEDININWNFKLIQI